MITKLNLLYLIDDEAFASSTSAGLLGYTVPSAMSIFSTPTKKYTYDDFNTEVLPGAYARTDGAQSYVNFDLKIENSERSIACPTTFGNCRITYNQAYTPEYFDTMPNNVYFG